MANIRIHLHCDEQVNNWKFISRKYRNFLIEAGIESYSELQARCEKAAYDNKEIYFDETGLKQSPFANYIEKSVNQIIAGFLIENLDRFLKDIVGSSRSKKDDEQMDKNKK